MSNLNSELDILRLNNHLTKIISQEKSITELFQKVCLAIGDNNIYNFAWIINKQKQTLYNSNNEIHVLENKVYNECLKKTYSNTDVNKIANKNINCIINNKDNDSIIISSPIVHRSITIGIIAVSINRQIKKLEYFHKEVIEGISNQISNQIQLIETENQLKKEKQELTKSILNFKTIANLHSGSIIILDFNLNLIFGSQDTHKIIKEANNNSLKLNLKDILLDDRINEINNSIEILLSGKKENITKIQDLSDIVGYPLIIKSKSSILYNHHKEPENFISIIEDITKTSKIEKAAKEFERTYSTIFDKAPVGIAILDKDAYIINVNEEEQNILGYKKKEIIGKHISHFLTKNNKDNFKNFYDHFLLKGRVEAFVDLVNKDGKITHTRRIAKGVFDSNNKLIKIISHTQDITESHANQKQLRILSQAIDQSPAIISISDKDNRISYVNKKYTEVTGYSHKDAIGKKSSFIKSNFHSSDFYNELSNKINNGKQWQGKFCNKNMKGELYWEKAEISPFYNSKGEHAGFIKTAEDITKLLDIESRLAESNNTYQHVFELAPNPIIIHKDGLIVDMNSAAVNFANGDKQRIYNKDNYIGQKTSKYTTPVFNDLTKNRRKLMRSTGTALPMITETLYNSKNEARKVEMVSAPIIYNHEPAFMLVFEDITERINWINKLEESEYKFHSIFDTIPDSIIISRLSDGVIIDANKGFLTETQQKLNEVIGKTALELNLYNNQFNKDTVTNKILRGGKIDNYEAPFILKDGSMVTGLVSARKIKIDNTDAILFVVRNISMRKKMEQDLVNAKIKAEENDKLKTAFLANMSHEIRNPMNAIIGFSDLLKDDDLTKEELNKYIDIIQSKGDDLMILINDIIDVSKIESEVLEIEENNIDLVKLITDVKRNYELNFAKIENLNFIINLNNHKKCFIKADITRVHQIFNNLIDNALKFTTKGQISINLSIDNDIAKISVSDTGIGISKDNMITIFDRFTQVETNGIISGAGLGLCITKSLINLMQGSIDVESKLNHGTIFTISFPIINIS